MDSHTLSHYLYSDRLAVHLWSQSCAKAAGSVLYVVVAAVDDDDYNDDPVGSSWRSLPVAAGSSRP